MQEELIEIEHLPLAAPRKGAPAEGIYLKLWQDFVENDAMGMEGVLNVRGPVTQRAASVAASFMVYMGCNLGTAFTREAQEMTGRFRSNGDAFLAAWALFNKRVRHVNRGLRCVEFMLARVHPMDGGQIVEAAVPQITQADMDVIESMVVWWSTDRAAQMRSTAGEMIQKAQNRSEA